MSTDPEWDAFVAGHRQQMEDALLPTLAEAQSVGIIPDPAKQLAVTYDQMRQEARVRGVVVEYPDGEPPVGTPMKTVTFASPLDGQPVQVPMPANPPAGGLKVRINGIEGVLYSEPGDGGGAALDSDDEWEVEQAITAAVNVNAQQVKHEGNVGLYGLMVSDSLRDEVIEAWAHYEDHGCDKGAALLDRIVVQLRNAFIEARGGA